MPIYDYECRKCQEKLLDHFKRMADAPPIHCDEPMHQIFQAKIEVWNSDLVFEHIAHEPMQFRNKRDLRAACKAHNVTSHLLDA